MGAKWFPVGTSFRSGAAREQTMTDVDKHEPDSYLAAAARMVAVQGESHEYQQVTIAVLRRILELKETINTMVDKLNAFASEVTRVARGVGTEGRLGGQANVLRVGVSIALWMVRRSRPLLCSTATGTPFGAQQPTGRTA
jgi:hypothetical protein